MKTKKIIYALTLLSFSSLSLANEPLESSREIAVKNRIEEIRISMINSQVEYDRFLNDELRVSMINSQVELDKLRTELAALGHTENGNHTSNSDFFRIKLESNEKSYKDNFHIIPLIENPEKLKQEKVYKGSASKIKKEEVSFLFPLLIIAVFGYLFLGLYIDRYLITKTKKQLEKVGL